MCHPVPEHFLLDLNCRGQGAAAFFDQFSPEVCAEGIDRILFRSAAVYIKMFQSGVADGSECETVQFCCLIIADINLHGPGKKCIEDTFVIQQSLESGYRKLDLFLIVFIAECICEIRFDPDLVTMPVSVRFFIG